MKCPFCSADVMDGFSFCPKCGRELPADVPVQPVAGKAENGGAGSSDPDMVPFEQLNSGSAAYNENTPDFAYPASPAVPTEPSSMASAAVQVTAAPAVPSAPVPVPAKEAVAETPVRPGSIEIKDASYAKPAQKAPGKGETSPILSKEYKPLTTAGVFWYFILTCIPVIGFICLLSFAFGGKNRSKKSLSRAMLIGWLIFVILICISFVIGFIFFQDKLVNLFNMDNWVSLGNYFAETFLNL